MRSLRYTTQLAVPTVGAAMASPLQASSGVLSAGREAGVAPRFPSECPAVPSMPDLDAYEILQDDDRTFAVVFARTGTVVQLNGMAQLGLDIDRADDVDDH